MKNFDFTREELFIYFEDYTQEQVVDALEKLGEDPNAEGYPASITDRLERIFAVVKDAIASSKQLPGSTLATVEQKAVELAGDRAIDITPDLIHGMLDILGAQAAVEAYALHQHTKAVRDKVLVQLQANDLAETNRLAADRMTALQKLCSDTETLDQILSDYGLLTQDEATREQIELTASCSLDFDPDKFLSEVQPEKKQLAQPKTIADTQRLAKTLLTRALK